MFKLATVREIHANGTRSKSLLVGMPVHLNCCTLLPNCYHFANIEHYAMLIRLFTQLLSPSSTRKFNLPGRNVANMMLHLNNLPQLLNSCARFSPVLSWLAMSRAFTWMAMPIFLMPIKKSFLNCPFPRMNLIDWSGLSRALAFLTVTSGFSHCAMALQMLLLLFFCRAYQASRLCI
jgi:hypothetical protein